MTPDEKERWRWTFAGQAMQAVQIANGSRVENGVYGPNGFVEDIVRASIHMADALITALEASETKVEACWHDFSSTLGACIKCGARR